MPHTIALVDDDQNILASLSAALEDEGYSVDTYADGEEALGVQRAPTLDVLLVPALGPQRHKGADEVGVERGGRPHLGVGRRRGGVLCLRWIVGALRARRLFRLLRV